MIAQLVSPWGKAVHLSIYAEDESAKKAKFMLEALVKIAHERLPADFFVKKMIWGVSLYLELGSLKEANWRNYHRVSDAALEIKKNKLHREWKDYVTFEHPKTLSTIYDHLIEESANLTVDRAAEIIGEYPPVIVTKEECRATGKSGPEATGKRVPPQPERRCL